MITISISRTNIADELRRQLSKGIVVFTYRTKDGYRRKAIGTRNLDLVRRMGIYVESPKSDVHRPNCYYDLEKRGWRSYLPQNIISIGR